METDPEQLKADGSVHSAAHCKLKKLKIRTITLFLPDDAHYEEASEFLRYLQARYEYCGYEVQTVRLVDNHNDSPEECSRVISNEKRAKRCCIEFLNVGSIPNTSPALLSCCTQLNNTSYSIAWQPHWGPKEAGEVATSIFSIAQKTDGEGNFRLGVSFNCNHIYTPFFPAATKPPNTKHPEVRFKFAIGLENSGLLYDALESCATRQIHGSLQHLGDITVAIKETFDKHLKEIERIAEDTIPTFYDHIKDCGLRIDSNILNNLEYLGIDTSVAPSLERPSIPDAFALLNLGPFGGPGTLAVIARITEGLKSIDVKKTGYCGCMLPVCEDQGLAAAAKDKTLTIQTLLQYSAVCGVGLDTVPIPGSFDSDREKQEVISRVAGVLLDVASMSERMNKKPLSVRFLPAIGKKAGEYTEFRSPYLCNSVVMDV